MGSMFHGFSIPPGFVGALPVTIPGMPTGVRPTSMAITAYDDNNNMHRGGGTVANQAEFSYLVVGGNMMGGCAIDAVLASGALVAMLASLDIKGFTLNVVVNVTALPTGCIVCVTW